MTSIWSLLLFLGLAIGVHGKLQLPQLQLSKHQWNQLQLPNLQLPNLKVPNLKLPNLQFPKLQLLKQQTQELTDQNPRNGPACFTVYKPELDDIASQYEIDYTRCTTIYNQQTALEDTKWQGPRTQLEERGQYACRTIVDCSTIVGYVEAFECYAQMGTEQSKSMYALSADANDVAVEMQESYRVIETYKTVCVNDAERTYVEHTTNTYEELNSCLAGKVQPKTTSDTFVPTTRTTPSPILSTTRNY
ncbi:uncharacterized protein LOC117575152 [Drosophila albomicans]|uniref:Uncharacterized protein LOC117575152 n=1 Tax=Drosophila albomicans TaxID=7291 RepID=A0A6P8XFJ0_DROAB|nr:uncharacterized protein LOC117575152 [Drosophila albomicans]